MGFWDRVGFQREKPEQGKNDETELSKQLRQVAEGHERAEELKRLADEFDQVTQAAFADPPVASIGKFMKTWAQCRVLLHECTGEPLV